MTAAELNALVAKLIETLETAKFVGVVSSGIEADDTGTLPEIYVEFDGVDLCLTIAPI